MQRKSQNEGQINQNNVPESWARDGTNDRQDGKVKEKKEGQESGSQSSTTVSGAVLGDQEGQESGSKFLENGKWSGPWRPRRPEQGMVR